jgi:hypothetical protein
MIDAASRRAALHTRFTSGIDGHDHRDHRQRHDDGGDDHDGGDGPGGRGESDCDGGEDVPHGFGVIAEIRRVQRHPGKR